MENLILRFKAVQNQVTEDMIKAKTEITLRIFCMMKKILSLYSDMTVPCNLRIGERRRKVNRFRKILLDRKRGERDKQR